MKKSKKIEMPPREITITIAAGGIENSYQVTYPTYRKLIAIENLKQQLSNGNYGRLIATNTSMSDRSLLMIDCFSYFSVLIADLEKDLNINSLLDLDFLTGRPLITSYRKQFIPWFLSWEKYLNGLDDESEDGE